MSAPGDAALILNTRRPLMKWNPVDKVKDKFKSKSKDWNPAREFESLLGKAKREVDSSTNWAKGQISKAANDARYSIEQTANKARHSVADARDDALQDINEGKIEILKGLEGELDNVAKEVIQDALEKISGASFNKAVDIVQTAAPDSLTITLSFVKIQIDNIKERIDTLQRWADNPPSSKDDIKEVIITLLPTKVSLVIDGQISAVVLTSTALKVGIDASYTTQSFLDKYDDLVKHF